MTTLSKANTTAQWYANRYPGGTMSRLDKFLLHSTETRSWPGYGGGASAPTATYHPLRREIRQHFPNEMSARALRDPSGTAVRENRDNVFQLEIIAYSDFNLAKRVGGLWIGDLTASHFADIAQMILELGKHGVPPTSSVKWKEGQKTYVSGVRLSGPAYDAYKGILAHMHASGNDHWDTGGLYCSKLKKALEQGLPDTGEDDEVSAQEVWGYTNKSFGEEDAFARLRRAEASAGAAYEKAEKANRQLESVAAGLSALSFALKNNNLITTEEQEAINAELSGQGKPGLSR